MPLQPGKTITKNGKTYILNEHHRWTLKDHHEAQQRRAAGPVQKNLFDTKGDPNQGLLFKTDDAVPDSMVAKPQGGGAPAKPQPKFDPATGQKMPGAGTGTSPGYANRVSGLEKQGMTTSDAQGIADMEELKNDPNSPIGKPKPQPAQPQQKPKSSPNLIKSGVEDDPNHDGVADQARVGVPAFEVPPPPKKIRRLANLTGKAKAAESHFADEFEQDPDGMAEKAHILFTASLKEGEAPVFETDACKKLSPYWQSTDLEQNLDNRSKNRATLNTALHQTANAICKKAFLHHLDTMERGQEILVTVGGCGAGKGFALKNVPQALELKKRANVVWDSAGDQNATENPWILQEARKRGLRVAFVFVHADPKVSWADPGRGVVKRAQDQNDGRMVDAKVFADSYALGARHHAAFISRHGHDPDVTSVVLKNGNPPMLLPGMPEEALQYDRQELAQFAIDTINNDPTVPEHIRSGALGGTQIWED